MKRFTFPLILILSLSLLLPACSRREKQPLGADAPPGAVPEIAGEYVVNGFDPDEIEYSGVLRISPGGQPGAYRLQWVITGDIQEGEGRLNGNQLEVTWHTFNDLERTTSGTAKYTITVNRELYGTRNVEGNPKPGTETAYPND